MKEIKEIEEIKIVKELEEREDMEEKGEMELVTRPYTTVQDSEDPWTIAFSNIYHMLSLSGTLFWICAFDTW